VTMQSPSLRWAGDGYLDSNEGDAPLEDDFVEWDWCRAPRNGGTAILYDATRRVGGEHGLALHIAADGAVEPFAPPPRAALPGTRWRIRRRTRCDADAAPALRKTLEDAPFYARSVVETQLGGERLVAVHETLSLDRFRRPWVQAMLPFRIPRRW
ncbi:MAG: carotenoid 1,2-hydratase, partial [Acetobacteraceae bacterium]|nr:carotenoid 1,2-hydratase [Acetobacteraceae bacterium]